MISYGKIIKFKFDIKTQKMEIRNKIINEFNKIIHIRRLICKIIMGLIIIFFFYYSIVFCSIYRKTQLNWFIGGIWSLLFEWFILSPFYILFISLIQKFHHEKATYYMMNLFVF